jgi:hypothetical protein
MGFELSTAVRNRRLASRTDPLEGIVIEWPKSVPRRGSVPEAFVFVVTTKEVDLRALETSTPEDDLAARKAGSASYASFGGDTAYKVIHIPYMLHWPEERPGVIPADEVD